MSDQTFSSAGSFSSARARRRQHDALEFRVMIVVTYPGFLVAALAGRLLPRRADEAGRRGSVFKEALNSARTLIPYAFMG